MKARFPQSTRWTGPYLGNYQGDLWRTFNIDLDNSPGHINLSRSPINAADTTDTNLLNMGVIDAFVRTNADGQDKWWALSRDGRLIKTDTANSTFLPSATWDEDTLANSPTNAKDMAIHENDSDSSAGENFLIVTRDTAIAVLNDTATNVWNGAWGGLTLKAGVPHPIEYFPFQRISLVGDGNLIHTIDKNRAVSNSRLVLPIYLQVWAIFTTPFRAWILCQGLQGRNGAIIEWNGFSQTYDYIHDAQSSNVLAGVDYFGVPIVVNNHGLILEYNGSSFYPMVRNGQKIAFSFFQEVGNTFFTPIYSLGYRGDIAARGMTVTDDGLIYINAHSPFLVSPRNHGGVYCLNPETGSFYSKFSLNMGSDTDYGQSPLEVGAIKAISPESANAINSYLLAGGRVSTNSGVASQYAIWRTDRTFSSTARRGFFITQFIPSNEIQEVWDNLWLELSAFKATSDKVIVKARGLNPLLDATKRPLDKSITWTSTTTFTVTLAAGDDSLLVGDETEIYFGKNGGVLAHITVISGAHAALQTITIDETVVNGSGVSLCRFDRWKKLAVITDNSKYVVPVNIGIPSSFIQLKVELRGPGNDFDIKSIKVNSEKQTKIKK